MQGSHSSVADDSSLVGCHTVVGQLISSVLKDIGAFILKSQAAQEELTWSA
jgi:hypothetical protein